MLFTSISDKSTDWRTFTLSAALAPRLAKSVRKEADTPTCMGVAGGTTCLMVTSAKEVGVESGVPPGEVVPSWGICVSTELTPKVLVSLVTSKGRPTVMVIVAVASLVNTPKVHSTTASVLASRAHVVPTGADEKSTATVVAAPVLGLNHIGKVSTTLTLVAVPGPSFFTFKV